MTAPSATTKSTRIAAIDAMRLLLACLVVLGHGWFLRDVNFFASVMFGNGFARIIVPFFLLVSGYFFERQTRKGVMPWFRAVLFLHVFWSIFFLPLELTHGTNSLAKLIFFAVVGYGHLWFLPALGLGGLILFRVTHWSDRKLIWVSLTLLCLGAAIQWAQNLLIDMDNLPYRNAQDAVARNFLFYGFPYLAIGFAMRRARLLERLSAAQLGTGLLCGFALMLGEALLHWHVIGATKLHDIFLSAVIIAPLLFEVCRQSTLDIEARHMSDMAATTYFLHPAILIPLRDFTSLPASLTALVALIATLAAARTLIYLDDRLNLHLIR